jgi:glc operon protein GlcG
MSMTLDDAQKIIAAAQQKASNMGLTVTVAVVDGGAHLVALSRMDGASPMSPMIATGKAAGAALFGRDGASLLSTANDRPAFWAAVKDLGGKDVVPGPGSLPVKRDGIVIGAVGVSGAKPDEDLVCAEAGVASVS